MVNQVRVEADLDVCIAAGMCVLTAPEVFDQNERDGRVVVRSGPIEPPQEEAVRTAVDLCPSGALVVVAGD